MPRPFLAILSLFFVAANPADLAAQQADTVEAILRAIDITPFGRVILGRHFAYRVFRGRKLADGQYQLRGGQYADTRAIIVAVDSANRVTAIAFEYLPGKRYAKTVADYATGLGPPFETQARDSAGVRVLVTRWQDAETRFEVSARQQGDSELVMSRMTDRVHH